MLNVFLYLLWYIYYNCHVKTKIRVFSLCIVGNSRLITFLYSPLITCVSIDRELVIVINYYQRLIESAGPKFFEIKNPENFTNVTISEDLGLWICLLSYPHYKFTIIFDFQLSFLCVILFQFFSCSIRD